MQSIKEVQYETVEKSFWKAVDLEEIDKGLSCVAWKQDTGNDFSLSFAIEATSNETIR